MDEEGYCKACGLCQEPGHVESVACVLEQLIEGFSPRDSVERIPEVWDDCDVTTLSNYQMGLLRAHIAALKAR